MYPLELWLLNKFCDRYGIDYQEIDDTLSYYENKAHLQKLQLESRLPAKDERFGPLGHDLSGVHSWEDAEDKWEAEMAWYLDTHFLEYYCACVEAGWTVSGETGSPISNPGLFSLSQMK